jgi:hypothetical protein
MAVGTPALAQAGQTLTLPILMPDPNSLGPSKALQSEPTGPVACTVTARPD